MPEAALHLSFDGFDAVEADSDAFLDDTGSTRVSETLGYERNGRALPGSVAGVDHAEQVAVWVCKNHEVRVLGVVPLDACGAECL